jgi:hypothetical protein
LPSTCALIMLDFDQPWDMLNSLKKWMGVLEEMIFNMLPKLPLSV